MARFNYGHRVGRRNVEGGWAHLSTVSRRTILSFEMERKSTGLLIVRKVGTVSHSNVTIVKAKHLTGKAAAMLR